MEHDRSAGQKCRCRAPSDNDGGQRSRRASAGEAWLGTLSPSCHLAHTEGSGPPSCRLGPENQNRGGIHPSPNKLHSADKPKASWWCCAVSPLKKKRKNWEIAALNEKNMEASRFLSKGTHSFIILHFPVWVLNTQRWQKTTWRCIFSACFAFKKHLHTFPLTGW